MCGILGAYGVFSLKTALMGLRLIDHRGPDNEGFFYESNLFLGHQRLSIQDTTDNSNQPFYSNCRRYIIIYNGEIYNLKELKLALGEQFIFRTSGDTEVLLESYIKFGVEIFSNLNGIFAFAIFDTLSDELVIVRDHFGVKPLYYYFEDDLLLFGSEMKSFLPFGINKQISAEALFNYLFFLWSPGDMTPFQSVKKLLPGHYIKINLKNKKSIELKKYDKLFVNCRGGDEFEEAYYVDRLEELLLKSVESQLLSDVPFGFFLSGGLDSSLIVAMAKKLRPNVKLNCYTIDLKNNGRGYEGFVDDLIYAKEVASYLDVDLNIVETDIGIVEMFDKMVWYLDEPQADSAPLNVWQISKIAAAANIKVLLGGAGGDDIFSGYRRHSALNMERYIKRMPRSFIRLLQFIIGLFPVSVPFWRRLNKLTINWHRTPEERQLAYFSWLTEDKTNSLFTAKWRKRLLNYNPFSYFITLNSDLEEKKSELDQMLYYELKTFLVDHNLNYTDKLGMASGVEIRVPFLDRELVEFARIIPSKYKMKGTELKYILKKVAEKYLPHNVIYRPKSGFGAPVRSWINTDLSEMIQVRLSPKQLEKRGIFDSVKVWQLIEDNKKGKTDASYTIWALLAIESWFIQFVDEK